MPRSCTICTHPARDAIEESLLAKEPLRPLAARFDTSTGALQRHKAEHLPAAILKANDAAEAARGNNLLAKISDLEAAARRIAAKAREEQRPENRDRRDSRADPLPFKRPKV